MNQFKLKLKRTIKALIENKGIYYFKNAKEDYFTYWMRPKSADLIEYKAVDTTGSNVAILIQGPIKLENDFTLETVKLYKKIFPHCKIIVSTWEDEAEEVIDKIKTAGAYVVQSKLLPVDLRRQGSVNLQRETSYAGVQLAKELNCEYICKTRSDHRIYYPKAMSFLLKMIEQYPLTVYSDRVKKRLIACSVGTFSNRLYNVSDLFLFGTTEDIARYFSCPQDTRNYQFVLSEEHGHEEYSKQRPGEIWFTTHYLENIGADLKWTKEDSDLLRNTYFMIIDNAMIDLYWDKYTNLEYRWRNYNNRVPLEEVTFEDWVLEML